MLGRVEVPLHIAHRHGRQARQIARIVRPGLRQFLGRYGLVHDPQPRRFGPGDHVGREVELTGLGRSDQMGEEIRAAVVAREAHLRERRRQLGALGGDPQIAGQRQRKPRPGRGAWDHRQRGLGHLVQPLDHFHAAAQALDPALDAGSLGRADAGAAPGGGREALDVAAGAEGSARPGQNHAAHRRIVRQPLHRLRKRRAHLAAQRIARLRPVHGQGGDTVLDGLDQLLGHRASSAYGGIIPQNLARATEVI